MTLRRRLTKALRQDVRLIVLSDFDGTLAPIAERPEGVRLPPPVRRTLARLARHPRSRVGILSGRSLKDVRRRAGIPGAAYAGCHGLEIAWRRTRFRHPGAVAAVPLLRRAARELRERTRRFEGAFLEWKGLTVSLHFRLADRRAIPTLRAIVWDVSRRAPGLEVLPGKKVLEFRPRVTWGKGEAALAIRDLLAKSLRRQPPLTIYLGDDKTDEEAFRALRGKAISVAVGRRRARAAYRLRGPGAVESLLAWIADALAGVTAHQAVR